MRYMLMIYGDERAFASLSPEQLTESMQEYEKYSAWLREKGWMREGDQLADTDKATTVRGEAGQILTVDGPYAETKEQLGGYYILECEHLDDAIEAAKRVPSVAWGGSVEVRPIIDM
jgi:hypothetical protein